jgi:hypothetical protein
LSNEHQTRLRHILSQKVGAGFWIWKPIVLDDAMSQIAVDDVLVYADAGCVVNKDGAARLDDYLTIVKEHPTGMFGFQLPHAEQKFTCEKVFEYFGVPAASTLRTSGHMIAGVLVIRKCAASVRILKRFLDVTHQDPELFSEAYSSYDPFGKLQAHRHDQSIFSVLRKIEGVATLPAEVWSKNWDRLAHVPIQARRLRVVRTS